MNKLFKVSIKQKYYSGIVSTLYVIKSDKESAIKYAEQYLREDLYVHKIVCLGEAISGIMFKKIK